MKPMNKNKQAKHFKHLSKNSKISKENKNKRNDYHFSGETKNISSKKKTLLNTKNLHKKYMKDKNFKELYPYLVEYVGNKKNNQKNLKEIDIVNIIRLSIAKSYEFSVYRRRIENFVNDDVIMELNEEFLSGRRDSLKTLLLCLNRQGIIPLEVVDKINEYGLELIVPRTNIFKIIPDDLVKGLYKLYCLDKEKNNLNDTIMPLYEEKKKLIKGFKKYHYEKPDYYKFVKNVLYGYRSDNYYLRGYRYYDAINENEVNQNYINAINELINNMYLP